VLITLVLQYRVDDYNTHKQNRESALHTLQFSKSRLNVQ